MSEQEKPKAVNTAETCMRCKGPKQNPYWWGCNACVARDTQEGLCRRD